MSFTFDDIGKPTSEATRAKINKLSARIAELRSAVDSNSSDAEERNRKIVALEQQRQRLSNGRHKPVELWGRAVDDSGNSPSRSLPQQHSTAGFRAIGVKVGKWRTQMRGT